MALITGAGRGLGREHALLMAAEGAAVVVNDVDGDQAAGVVAEICGGGGRAVAAVGDVADWSMAASMVETAVASFGGLHVLVNNAGILRDRFLVNMTEAEWDEVVAVHLKGHVAPLRWAAAHWRTQTKAGCQPTASVINTSSTSGLFVNAGQANYGAAKAAIAALTQLAAAELGRYGVRVNAIAPLARTRLTESTPGLAGVVAAPADPDVFDAWHPANVSPLVAYLATEGCRLNGQVLAIHGGRVQWIDPWSMGRVLDSERRWTVEDLATAIDGSAEYPGAARP